MRYLLDVNVLVAAILQSHINHPQADRWIVGKRLATCPLSETGYLRIVTHPKIYGVSMPVAREALRDFISRHRPMFVADDLPALNCPATASDEVTDLYLAALADKHGMKLATLDTGISHAAVEIIA